MASVAKNPVPDSDVSVTFEDQQQINKFARHNAKLQDLKEELEKKKKEMQNIEDAMDELLLQEEGDLIPYQIGEVFVHSSIDSTSEMLEAAKAALEEEVAGLEAKSGTHKQVLSDLKVKLYAKFGNNINLEADEEAT